MNINYKLTYSDFLEHQLYTSSTSKLHNKKRFKARILIPIIYILLAIFTFIKNNNSSFPLILAAVAVLWFLFYPLYSKWYYKKHFKKHLKENYKNRVNIHVEIYFDADFVNAKDVTSESKIKGTEIKELIETQNHFFLKLKTNLSFIIPKYAIENPDVFKKVMANYGAAYVNELNWKWKWK